MYITCRVALRGKPVKGLFRVYSDGEVTDTKGVRQGFEIDLEHTIIGVV